MWLGATLFEDGARLLLGLGADFRFIFECSGGCGGGGGPMLCLEEMGWYVRGIKLFLFGSTGHLICSIGGLTAGCGESSSSSKEISKSWVESGASEFEIEPA